ncbi:unnamed protein product [Protopolystoma xenopodis]|uniref:Uncharacterized protein n=1 Tax=Protopolystoma xenopodis TaxID=117903 RepID=A0A3S5CKF4_9PLAT|nr:unnamed protein product [Protopolystoma xenopodis]
MPAKRLRMYQVNDPMMPLILDNLAPTVSPTLRNRSDGYNLFVERVR